MNLWATWCLPCRVEMPSLDNLQKEIGDKNFQVVIVAVERTAYSEIDKFLKKDQNKDLELAAEDLRMATRHLGCIVGKVDVEEILGSIFKDFCIGK